MRYKVTLNGKVYEVEVERGEAIVAAEYDAVAPKPAVAPAVQVPVPANVLATGGVERPLTGEPVNAPLPGTVVSVKVKEGEKVKKGQMLVIIEAMKMENEILAPRAGTVSQVCVKIGAAVNSGDPMIVLA